MPGRPFRGGSRTGNRPGTHERASEAHGRGSDGRSPAPARAHRRRSGSASSSGVVSSSRASGINWRAIGSPGSLLSMSAVSSGVNGDRVARGNGVERCVGAQEARLVEGGDGLQRAHSSIRHGGVHITSSMRLAPVASMARRSKPMAQPAAGGIAASAARKSSSRG